MSEEKKKINNPLKNFSTKKDSPKKSSDSPAKKEPKTRAQKIFRGPLFWIIVAIIAVSFFGQISSASNRYTVISTSQALDAITKSEVESALLIDKDQKIQLILKSGQAIKGATKVEASYVIRQEPTIVDALTANPPAKGLGCRCTSTISLHHIPLLIWTNPHYWIPTLLNVEQCPGR